MSDTGGGAGGPGFNTPASAALNGPPGNLNATNHANQLNQHLVTGAMTFVCGGTPIVVQDSTATPNLYGGFFWLDFPGDTNHFTSFRDVAQPFTMPAGETTIGRVQIAMRPRGDCADVKVSLYTDNGGVPGTEITSTLVPRSWIINQSADKGFSSGNPLATSANTIYVSSFFDAFDWATPAGSSTALLKFTTYVGSGQYVIFVGGSDSPTGSTSLATVYTIPLSDDAEPQPAVTQPSLPQPLRFMGASVTSDTLIVVGGIGSGGTRQSTTYTASWDGNTGTIGAWTNQVDYPLAVSSCPSVTWNDSFVYVVGGIDDSSTVYKNVYMASISNGTINSWTAMPSLPAARYGSVVAVIEDTLIVAGGFDSTGVAADTTYYAKINTDGSFTGWYTGPTMPVGVGTNTGVASVMDNVIFVLGGITMTSTGAFATVAQSLCVRDGALGTWQQQQNGGEGWALGSGMFALGDGTYAITAFTEVAGAGAIAATVRTVPFLSVPLPTTGLTPGETYHIVLHNVNGSAINFTDYGVYANATQPWLDAPAYTDSPWSSRSNFKVLMTVYNLDVNSDPLHVWQDPDSTNLAAATSTLAWNDASGQVLGYCESVLLPNDPQNSNPTFESGTSPWTVTGGTLTQSSAETHGGYTESGLITPDGVTATVYAQSEQIQATPGHWYQAQGWLFSPTGYSNVSLSVNWFDSTGAYLSTSSNIVTLTAATWTQQINNFQAPDGAAYATLVPTQGGTPSAADLLYLSYLTFTTPDPSALPSVAVVNYENTEAWGPTGVTQLV